MADIQQAREWLSAATSLAVLTGAGISAESGVQPFRGAGGLWKQYEAEELATLEAFGRNPTRVWEWYNLRREAMAKAVPNAGHLALVEFEKRKPRFTLITQNIDGLHDRAGSAKILKLHGDIWRMRCIVCGANWPDRRVPLPKLPPHCQCGGMARPDVVWFGEMLPDGMMLEAEHAASSAQVFLAIGTSGIVVPAATLVPYARKAGAKVIEINIAETPASGIADCVLRGPSGEILPQLL